MRHEPGQATQGPSLELQINYQSNYRLLIQITYRSKLQITYPTIDHPYT